jgi:hypothetical protein
VITQTKGTAPQEREAMSTRSQYWCASRKRVAFAGAIFADAANEVALVDAMKNSAAEPALAEDSADQEADVRGGQGSSSCSLR